MKREVYQYPKSSFLNIDKDMNIIINLLFQNERLKKLLFYTTKDALEKPKVSMEDTIQMMGKNIKNVPKLYVDSSVLTYVIINFDNFVPNRKNPEFRDNVIEFDVICHFDQWTLKDFQLRPYKIVAEIDSMLNKRHLTGIGDLEFLGANQILLTDEYAGLCVMYSAIHGEEDKKNAPVGNEDADIIENYNNIFNINPWQKDEDDGE